MAVKHRDAFGKGTTTEKHPSVRFVSVADIPVVTRREKIGCAICGVILSLFCQSQTRVSSCMNVFSA